jgi:hypothetical protein
MLAGELPGAVASRDLGIAPWERPGGRPVCLAVVHPPAAAADDLGMRLDPASLGALAAVLTALARLVWAIRRRAR